MIYRCPFFTQFKHMSITFLTFNKLHFLPFFKGEEKKKLKKKRKKQTVQNISGGKKSLKVAKTMINKIFEFEVKSGQESNTTLGSHKLFSQYGEELTWVLKGGVDGLQCTLHTIHWILHTEYGTLITEHWTLHTEYCTMHTAYCKLNTEHWTVYSVHSPQLCTLHATDYTGPNANCTAYTTNWKLPTKHSL